MAAPCRTPSVFLALNSVLKPLARHCRRGLTPAHPHVGTVQYDPDNDWTAVQRQRWDLHATASVSITGTLMWAPLSVLELEAHTVSSQLEGLFISILSISCEDRVNGHKRVGNFVPGWEDHRRGAMFRRVLREVENNWVCAALAGLVRGLHDLFYPPLALGDGSRSYRRNVTAREVQSVCNSACPAPLLMW